MLGKVYTFIAYKVFKFFVSYFINTTIHMEVARFLGCLLRPSSKYMNDIFEWFLFSGECYWKRISLGWSEGGVGPNICWKWSTYSPPRKYQQTSEGNKEYCTSKSGTIIKHTVSYRHFKHFVFAQILWRISFFSEWVAKNRTRIAKLRKGKECTGTTNTENLYRVRFVSCC